MDDESAGLSDPCCIDRPEAVERMVRFGYYLNVCANLLTDEQVKMLVEADYLDPRDVAREASEWCYGPGREIAREIARAISEASVTGREEQVGGDG